MDPSTNPSRAEGTNTTAQLSGVLFREIHKNAWLKKLPCGEKRIGAFPKKGDRVWVVFCVHDDVEAFLETYADQKVAVAHKPDWFASLNSCLHISPTICAQEEEYEFVVTLTSDLVRLTAPSWDTMMEWVDTIGSKLREMKILSPRENIYSKMPEARLPLAPTRDPNSPLPLPPAGPSSLLPGTEPISLADPSDSSSSSATVSSSEASSSSDSSDDNAAQPPQRAQYDNVSLEIGSSTTSLYITQSEPQLYARHRRALSRATSVPDSPLVFSSCLMSAPSTGTPEHADNNVTVIEVSNDNLSAAPLNAFPVFNFNFVEESLPTRDVSNSVNSVNDNGDHGDDVEINEAYFTPPLTPAVSSHGIETVTINPSIPRVAIREPYNNLNGNAPAETAVGSNNHYECVFLPNTESSLGAGLSNILPLCRPVNSFPRNSPEAFGNTAAEPSPQDSRLPPRRRRSSSNSEIATPSPRGFSAPDRPGRGTAAVGADMERRLQPAPHPYRQHGGGGGGGVEVATAGRLTLREQQVMQLRREMLHPGGVRLQLRRKDCTGSIALVDAFCSVWISGWKQREHPMLYNALHIGDQLISIAGVSVQNASDAQKLLRGATSLYVEFVIRRVPFGRVFAIRRETEGQSLGIVQEGNTAVIRDVLQTGPAFRQGLTAKVQSCDGLSLTPWVLTEINGRPLNLFFKDNEIRDRLNAVGREISILVQPFDLVKLLKKQLKSLRSYKDYILQ